MIPIGRVKSLMLILCSLLGIRLQRLEALNSSSENVPSDPRLKESICSYDGLVTKTRIDVTTCLNFAIISSRFSNIKYTGSVFIFNRYNGGAMSITSCPNVTITSSSFIDITTSGYGGAIFLRNNSLINLTDNTFMICKGDNGGSICCDTSSEVNIFQNTFSSSSSDRSGGSIYFYGSTNVKVLSCYFTSSTSKRDGGALYIYYSSIYSKNNHYTYCSANSGGALYFTSITTNASVSDHFSNSKTIMRGGAIYFVSSKNVNIIYSQFSDSSISNGTIDGSFISTPSGGTIYCESSSDVLIDGCNFQTSDCLIGSGGACSFEMSSKITFSNNKLTNCSAQFFGGAIHVINSPSINIANNSFNNCFMVNESNTLDRIGGAINIDSSTPVAIKGNNFEDCIAYQNGGSISLSSFNKLEIGENIFRNCSVDSNNGGALRIYGVELIDLVNNAFIGCHSSQYGGAVYIEKVILNLNKINITGDEYKECYSNGCGGAISLNSVDSIIINGVICSQCNSSQGGFIYTIDIRTSIKIINSNFDNCLASNEGGAICIWYKTELSISKIIFEVNGCNFSNCTGNNGGALFIERDVIYIKISKLNFLSCISKESGSAIYYKYDHTFNKDEISIFSLSNEFIDCESQSYGAFFIQSNNIHFASFINDSYTNCKAVGFLGTGGAFMASISDYCKISFVRCSFQKCAATQKYGALGVELQNSRSSNNSEVRLSGCLFEKCSSSRAACIGTQYTDPTKVVMYIESFEGVHTFFRLMYGKMNWYAVQTDASNVTIKETNFEQVDIGALHFLGKNLDIGDCSFNDSSSAVAINCYSLTSLKIDKLLFSKCSKCFQIYCYGLSNITSLIMIDTGKEDTSNIYSDTILLNNLTLINNKEPIIINVKQSLEINGGFFSNNEKAIQVAGSSETSFFYAHSLSSNNSLLFDVDKIDTVILTDCIISYETGRSDMHQSIITMKKISSSEIINCTFSVSSITPIEFTSDSSKGTIENCIFTGNESAIKVGSIVTAKNCDFNQSGLSFEITGGNGTIILYNNTNCFGNKIFSDSISVGEGKVTNHVNETINKFNQDNNKCFVFPATSEFSNSRDFLPSNYFSSSIMFKQTIYFTYSQDFKQTNYFSSSSVFKQTNYYSNSKEFEKTCYFSSSEIFKPTNDFNHSEEFDHNEPITSTMVDASSNIEKWSINVKAEKATNKIQSNTFEAISTKHDINHLKHSSSQRNAELTKVLTKSSVTTPSITRSVAKTKEQNKPIPTQDKPNKTPIATKLNEPTISNSHNKHVVTKTSEVERKQTHFQNHDQDNLNNPIEEYIPEDNAERSEKSGSTGAIVGAAVGFIAIVLIALIVLYVIRTKKKKMLDSVSFSDDEIEVDTFW